MTLVSVIVPIYNETERLAICIESLLAQRYKELEIILVDDGSDDDSLIISRQYAKEHPGIRLIEIANSGVSHARNVGIAAASGKFLTFVDSDDVVSSEYVGNLVQAIQNPEVDLAAGLLTFSNLETSTSNDSVVPNIIGRDEAALQFADSYGWYCCGKIYRRSLITAYSIRFNENVAVCEDLLFNYEVLQHCKHVALLKTADYLYWQGENSATNSLDNVRWFDALDAYKIVLTLSVENGALLRTLSFNCDFLLCEASYRLQAVSPDEQGALLRKMEDVAALLPQPRRYSLQQSIKLALFKLFPGVVMRVRRRRVAK